MLYFKTPSSHTYGCIVRSRRTAYHETPELGQHEIFGLATFKNSTSVEPVCQDAAQFLTCETVVEPVCQDAAQFLTCETEFVLF